MFDVGFTELMVIAVVALIVIGPERLPRVARTLGHLFGQLQRYVNDVKADINREIELDELRKFKSTFEDAARGFESAAQNVQSEVTKAESELNALATGADPSAPAPAGDKPGPASGSGETSATSGEAHSQPGSDTDPRQKTAA